MTRRAFVSTFYVPKPYRDSGSKRLFDMMRAMRKQGWDVTFVPAIKSDDAIDARRLRRLGVTVYEAEQIDVETLAATGSFDIALFAFWQIAGQMAPLFRARSPHTRVVVDSVDAQFVRDARGALRIGPSGGPTALLDSDYGDTIVGELNAYAAADCVLAVSQAEAELIGSLVNDRSLAHVVPDTERAEAGSASFDQRAGMLFVGGFLHLPNVDAVRYACEEILPLVPEELRRQHPFYVVGDSLDDSVRAYANGIDHVRMVGWVPTLTPYYERARIVLAPLRYGAGTKRKVIQALMANVPIVTSSIGAEGLHLEHERDILLADDPQSFAGAIERLLQDRPLWEQLATNTTHIVERHSEEAAAEALFTALDAAFARDPKPASLRPAGAVVDVGQLTAATSEQSGAQEDATSVDGAGADGAGAAESEESPDALDALADSLSSLVRWGGYTANEFRRFERNGVHVMPVHFYNPIPDTSQLSDEIWSRPSELVGIDMNDDEQLRLVREVFPQFREEYEAIPTSPTEDPAAFHFGNGLFDGTDALVLYCMLRYLRPRRVVEIGSGWSTRLAAQAARVNGSTDLVAVEPYPEEVLQAGFPGLTSLIRSKVEEVSLDLFTELEDSDVLFIDSSHVVRVGGDVNFLFLEVLPRLRPGVVVHVHDIFLPFEYRRDWVRDELRFWTEQYLVQAFLAFNSAFRVLFANSYANATYPTELRETFPNAPWWGGGSFWMQRRPGRST